MVDGGWSEWRGKNEKKKKTQMNMMFWYENAVIYRFASIFYVYRIMLPCHMAMTKRLFAISTNNNRTMRWDYFLKSSN